MQQIIEILTLIDNYISGHPIFIITLVGTGLFFTIYLGFPQIRYFRKSIQILRGKHDIKNSTGDASHFQALATALSGTVGTGNIAGVALAIHLGGPSALLWMVFTALIGMATKFVEVTLSHKYREKLPDGTIAGGPMYYMKKRLNIKHKNGIIPTGKWLAILFSCFTLICAFGTGCLPQINSISTAIHTSFGISTIVVGAVLSIVLASVVLGGIKRIVQVTEKLVPLMGVIYVGGALIVIACNVDNVIPGLEQMFCDALSGTSACGGFLGATVAIALSKGVSRGLFSNEAGQGSAPIAHAAARCKYPAQEGLVALLEPFIDTVVICSLTGLMIISSGVWNQKYYNEFQMADMLILKDTYNTPYKTQNAINDKNEYFDGVIMIDNGQIIDQDITIIHSHSIAEDVQVFVNGQPYDGVMNIKSGIPDLKSDDGSKITVKGKSLLHSAPLTMKAFTASIFGPYGEYIVTFSLLLFAFSTSIAWCYYGDRASSFLFGPRAIIPFRIIYVLAFFVGAFTDTTIIWSIASIGIVLMSMPNLIGILILRKEVLQEMEKIEENKDA
jgi:AGCS family alanine or glycine:cation symporter